MKKLIILVFVFVGITLNAQCKGKCISGNCENGFGTFRIFWGAIYKGNFKDGLFNGYGEITFPHDDGYYKGNFANGEKNGYGVQFYGSQAAGTKWYYGSWKNGLRNGYGKTIYYNGDISEGKFVDCVPDSACIETQTQFDGSVKVYKMTFDYRKPFVPTNIIRIK